MFRAGSYVSLTLSCAIRIFIPQFFASQVHDSRHSSFALRFLLPAAPGHRSRIFGIYPRLTSWIHLIIRHDIP